MPDTDCRPISRGHPEPADGCRHVFSPGVRLRKPWGVETLLARAARWELWELWMEPGADTSLHLHRSKTTWLDVLQGFGALIVGGETRPLVPGAIFQIPACRPHRLRAARDAPLLVWELESPPDKADILRLVDRHGRAGRPFLHGSRVLSSSERTLASPDCEVRLFEEACVRLAGLVVSRTPGRAAGSVEQLLAGAWRWTLARGNRHWGLGRPVDQPSSFREAK